MLQTTRIVTWIVLGLATSGCQSKDQSTKPNLIPRNTSTSQTPVVDIPAVNSTVVSFLKALKSQSISPEMLSLDYRKHLAPALFDADKMLGYSADKLTSQLKDFPLITSPEDAPSSTTVGDRVSFSVVPGMNGTMYIRLVRPEDRWLVDWIVFTAQKQPVTGEMPTDATQAAGWYAGFALLDLAQKNSFSHAALFLSKTGKAFLAPPIFDSEKPIGFSEEYLLRTALPRLFPAGSKCTGLTISGSTMTGDATIQGQARKVTIAVSPGQRPGEMFVDRVEFR